MKRPRIQRVQIMEDKWLWCVSTDTVHRYLETLPEAVSQGIEWYHD